MEIRPIKPLAELPRVRAFQFTAITESGQQVAASIKHVPPTKFNTLAAYDPPLAFELFEAPDSPLIGWIEK